MLVNVERVRDGKGKAKKRENKYLYLFNDLLIVAKRKRWVPFSLNHIISFDRNSQYMTGKLYIFSRSPSLMLIQWSCGSNGLIPGGPCYTDVRCNFLGSGSLNQPKSESSCVKKPQYSPSLSFMLIVVVWAFVVRFWYMVVLKEWKLKTNLSHRTSWIRHYQNHCLVASILMALIPNDRDHKS